MIHVLPGIDHQNVAEMTTFCPTDLSSQDVFLPWEGIKILGRPDFGDLGKIPTGSRMWPGPMCLLLTSVAPILLFGWCYSQWPPAPTRRFAMRLLWPVGCWQTCCKQRLEKRAGVFQLLFLPSDTILRMMGPLSLWPRKRNERPVNESRPAELCLNQPAPRCLREPHLDCLLRHPGKKWHQGLTFNIVIATENW